MKDIYQNYCCNDKYSQVATFLTIYIEEAHARDEWWLPDSPESKKDSQNKTEIYNHTSIEDRIKAAQKFKNDFSFDSEIVCDSFSNDVNTYFNAWPERLYIIIDGTVVYQGGMGPFDYKLAEVKDWLAVKYGLRGEVITRR
eukprot:gene10143-13644_t